MSRATDRILKLLEYAGPGGVTGHDVGLICHLTTARLYPLLTKMEREGTLTSEFGLAPSIGKARPRYYRLACYAGARA